MPHHLLRSSSRRALLAIAVAATGLACGEITGLSKDYDFDLEDAATADAGSDAPAANDASRADAGDVCTMAEAAGVFNGNGTAACRQCLAGMCCSETLKCAVVQPCNDALKCRLGCTEKNPGNRASCFTGCPKTTATYAIETCSQKSCAAACGFPP